MKKINEKNCRICDSTDLYEVITLSNMPFTDEFIDENHLGKEYFSNIEKVEFGEAWNFGPSDEGSITVEEVVNHVKRHWDAIDYDIIRDPNQPHEANLLKLDCSKAHILLKWKDVWDSDMTFEKTVLWYKNFYENNTISTMDDLNCYVSDATKKKLEWSI
ncbi:MAG: hypothetical protein WCW84_07780 [Sulfurimonas sp.]|jgi:CDP-glucose 4,6-dehydratase